MSYAAPRFGIRWALLAVLFSAILAASAFAVTAPVALGATAHPTVAGEYGKEGPKASGLGNGCHIAYQSANHRLYLYSDEKIYGLDRTAPGTVAPLGGAFPLSASNSSCGDPDMEVDNSTGGSANNIYAVPSSTSIYGWGPSGSLLGAPWPVNTGAETCGVAVTGSGEVWGGTYSFDQVSKYTAGGTSNGTIYIGYRFCKLAVDVSNDDLYVQPYSGGNIVKYSASSGYTAGLTFPSGDQNSGMAINGLRHRLYVGTNGSSTVKAYDTTTGDLVETIALGGSGGRGIAVDEATDTLFVAVGSGASGVIKEFPPVIVPDVTTGDPVGNKTVSGTVGTAGAGTVTECYFEYKLSTSGSYEGSQPCTPAAPFSEDKSVSAELPLLGEVQYTYRLVAANANGTARGPEQTITAHNVVGIATDPATEVSRTSAKLNGSFTGTSEPTTYYFEYGPTTAYGSRFPLSPAEESAGTTAGPTPMSVTVSGLSPQTVYHFRVVAKNLQGTSPGQDRQFETLPAVAGISTDAPSDLTPSTAVLHGSFTGNGEVHDYHFEWGPTNAYGQTTTGGSSSAAGLVAVSDEITGLEPYLPQSVPYHYRLVVTNAVGTTYGADMTVLPAPPDPPAVVGELVEDLSPTSARLAAEINPQGAPTIYRFEYGPSAEYGTSTSFGSSIGEDDTLHSVDASLSGLQPGTTYHFRVIALNFGGTTRGADHSFTTQDAPSIVAADASAIGERTAHLSTLVLPNGGETTIRFEYGQTSAYGQTTAGQVLPAGALGQPIGADLAGLDPGSTYHFRVVASNAYGASVGPGRTFATRAASTDSQNQARKKTSCKRGFVKRRGKCMKRKRQRRHHHRHG